MCDSVLLQKKWLKIVPHVVDSLLLITALILVFGLSINPIVQTWLMFKIIAVIIYIFLGVIFFRLTQTKKQQSVVLFFALSVFLYIVLVAVTKHVIPYLY